MELAAEFIGAPFENGGLLLDWPGVPPRSCVFVPLILREGGVLAAIPSEFLDASLISAGQAGAANAIVGPSRVVSVGTLEEEEEGALVPTEEMCTVLLVDFSEEVFPLLSRYDPVTSPAEAAHVVPESPHLQVSFEEARQSALAWVASEEGERLAFYSAAEGAEPSPVPGGPMEAAAPKRKTAPRAKRPTNAQLSEQLGALVELIPSLTQQVQELATRQTALEKRAAPVAAPPLPAHRLAFPQPNAAPAVTLDLPQPGDLEPPDEEIKLVSQQALRRLSPSEQLPMSRADLAQRRPVFTSYAERFGGFGSQRSLGIVFWLLANIADSMIAGDQAGAEELTALALAAVEQCAQDGGSWEIGFLLSFEKPGADLPRRLSDEPRTSHRVLHTLFFLCRFRSLGVSSTSPQPKLLESGFAERAVPSSLFMLARLKITGSANWNPLPFLASDPDLQFAFLEPDVLLYGGEPPAEDVPDLTREKPSEVAKLALKWAGQGLLYLKDDFSDQQSPSDCVRVFNCYKNLSSDRQIGDRRSRNFRERGLRGPSVSLPCGPCLLGLRLDPKQSTLRIAVADRKDFYHQLRVGDRKACHNALFPPLPEALFVGTAAHDDLLRRRANGRKVPSLLVAPPDRKRVVAGFKAIFQGDHLGVEFATCAHRTLLQGAGLLTPDQEVRANSLFPESLLYQGLVIDDFYAISIEKPELPPEASAAVACLDKALLTYAEHGLLGSSEKDVRGADTARVAGAELDASSRTRQDGIVGAGALRSKRLSLASISLSVAALPSTTDVLHSCLMGGWVSVFPLPLHFEKSTLFLRTLCDALASFGWVVGPILDPAFSPHYGLLDPVFFSWLLHMLETGSVDALYLRPSAKTFSAATVPPLRTYREPFGDPSDPRVRRGTLQALRALILFQFARLSKAICLVEQPVGSLMTALPSWKALREKPGVLEIRTAACMFGASSAQRVRLLSCHFSPAGLERVCSGGHQHGPPGSSDCFASALEVPGFASALAETVSSSLRRKVLRTQGSTIDVFGLESVLVNDLAQALTWRPLKVWRWRKKAHINVLESEAFLQLCFLKARQARPSRFVSLIDSNVARCSLGKGRSPSAALTSVLRRTASVSLACGLYGALPFCPTRLMPADAPSRGAPVLEATPGPSFCSQSSSSPLAALPRLRRWASNWVRLVLKSLLWASPARLEYRRERPLPSGRPVEKITQKHRDRLWAAFLEWIEEIGVPAGLFEASAEVDIDSINAVLAKYGRALYETGRPYNHYAETVNALASKIPKIRRLLQPAWDVAFQWQRMEPHVHHQAMPWQVLLAMCSTALCWGWKEVAGTLALAWDGLARSRFAKLLTVLHLDKLDATNLKALDLGSLRAGGATWLLQTSEAEDLVSQRIPESLWFTITAARKCKHLYHCLEEQKASHCRSGA
ncbi:unnamed protein product [Symbiodinium sp. KB8]|nr:unnamed protein product [Symbiodinium sp. KB8]